MALSRVLGVAYLDLIVIYECYTTVVCFIFVWLNFRAFSFQDHSRILNFCKEKHLLITIVAEPYKTMPGFTVPVCGRHHQGWFYQGRAVASQPFIEPLLFCLIKTMTSQQQVLPSSGGM